MPAISDVSVPQVTVEEFVQEHGERLELQLISGAGRLDRAIREPTLNRPGLALAGHTRYFACHRMQVLGSMEIHFLRGLPLEDRRRAYDILFTATVPCVVIARGLRPDPSMLAAADRAGIPVFRTRAITMKFINKATIALEAMSARRTTLHGSMVDILGIGVVVQGESGIGKSESVLALLERGYSLVADDYIRVRVHDDVELLASANPMAQHLMEVRGIGIVDVARMFGVRAVRENKVVDLIVTLKPWNDVVDVDRLGIDLDHVELLGIRVPHIVIPVRPGRDLARLIEVAALQVKLHEAGHNAGATLSQRVQDRIQAQTKASASPKRRS
ncbi:MAG: HPr(Ser) kinase/phosphatase [Verrucomicrobiales bacterium]|jgi:HPr kinase/phosphorylase|nr:HPr(Ser) kinase/phosphatase [Verrucomicrobiales bacterium]